MKPSCVSALVIRSEKGILAGISRRTSRGPKKGEEAGDEEGGGGVAGVGDGAADVDGGGDALFPSLSVFADVVAVSSPSSAAAALIPSLQMPD